MATAQEDDIKNEGKYPEQYDNTILLSRPKRSKEKHMDHAAEAEDIFVVDDASALAARGLFCSQRKDVSVIDKERYRSTRKALDEFKFKIEGYHKNRATEVTENEAIATTTRLASQCLGTEYRAKVQQCDEKKVKTSYSRMVRNEDNGIHDIFNLHSYYYHPSLKRNDCIILPSKICT